jgi:hypothetical protein
MKAKIVAALIVLVLMAVSSVSAQELAGSWLTSGDQKTYTYAFTNTWYGDTITSIHIYAPLSVGLILGSTGPADWSFGAVMDPDPEVGADIYWYANNYDTGGIPENGQATFTLTVPSWTGNDDSFIVPGCFANWGFELQSWPDSVMVWFDSVPVPVGTTAGAPEPASLAALAVGCIALLGLRRRR